jgi:pimeloyl-ACP methyl ester carboxylesterase
MPTNSSLVTHRRPRQLSAVAGDRRKKPAPVRQREIMLHGQQVTFLETGADTGGPVVVLLHGLAGSSQTWASVLPLLGAHSHVIAPDLLGHGRSAKPRSGDYSPGAYAAGLRDLLVALDVRRATVVGHSFGRGVAMQFAYQFPERLALVASGGLGPEVSFALRAATLPGTTLAPRIAAAITPRWLARLSRRLVRAVPTVSGAEIDGLAERSTPSPTTEHAARSPHRARSTGLVGATPRRHRTPLPPRRHPRAARRGGQGLRLLPVSRLEVFDGAGHFPHVEQPQRFAHVLSEFLATSTPARVDVASMRRRLLHKPSIHQAT